MVVGDWGKRVCGRYLSKARNRANLNAKKMCPVSICDDENVLEMSSSDGCTVNVHKKGKLYIECIILKRDLKRTTNSMYRVQPGSQELEDPSLHLLLVSEHAA